MAGTILILRGESMSGKTAVAKQIARSFARGAHVEIDRLLDFFQEDRSNPSQIQIALLNAASCVNNLTSAGFDVVVDWLFWEPELLDLFLSRLKVERCEVHLITLLVSHEARRARRAAGAEIRRRFEHAGTSARFGQDRERRGARIDTSALSVEEVSSSAAEVMDGRRAIIRAPGPRTPTI